MSGGLKKPPYAVLQCLPEPSDAFGAAGFFILRRAGHRSHGNGSHGFIRFIGQTLFNSLAELCNAIMKERNAI